MRICSAIVCVALWGVGAWAQTPEVMIIKPAAAQQLATRLSTEKGPIARHLKLQSAAVSRDKVKLSFGRNDDAKTTFHVTLVHPSKASPKAIKAGAFAIEPIPGPASDAYMKLLAKRLSAPFAPPVWSRLVAKKGPTKAIRKKVSVGQSKPKKAAVRRAIPFEQIRQKIAMGDEDEALKMLQRVSAQPQLAAPDRADTAVLLKKIGQTDHALRLAKTLKAVPLSDVARVIEGKPRSDAAILASLKPKQACQATMVARAMMTFEQYDLALSLLQAIHKVDPDCIRGFILLAHTHLATGKVKRAISLLEPIVAKHPKNDQLAMMLSNAHRSAGNLEKAVDIVEKVVKAGHTRDDHVRLLVTMYLQRQDEKKQIRDWRAVAEANPKDNVARMMVGVLLHYRDRFKDSEAWLAPVQDVFKDNPRYLVYRAMNAYNLGDAALARKILDRAATLRVVDPDVYYCRGELLRDTERALAIKDFQRYLNLTAKSYINLPEKQDRVRTQIKNLQACAKSNVAQCDGPWEHPRGGLDRLIGLHITELTWGAVGFLLLLIGVWAYRRRSRKVEST